MAFTSWCKVIYQCGIACLYDRSKLHPYCRQWPRLLTVSPVSTYTWVELRDFCLSVPWTRSSKCNWEVQTGHNSPWWKIWVLFKVKKLEAELSVTFRGVFMMKWSWAPLAHYTKVPLKSLFLNQITTSMMRQILAQPFDAKLASYLGVPTILLKEIARCAFPASYR